MFVFLPIGTAKRITTWPFLTIGLICFNVLFWMMTNSVLQNQQRRMTEIQDRMLLIERPYFYFGENLRLEELTGLGLDQRIDMVLAGEVMDPESDDFLEWMALYDEWMRELNGSVFRRFGFIPATLHPFKILTAMFIHGGFMHLIGNMLFLWVVGCNLENDMGIWKYAGLYLASGFGAALLHWTAGPSSQIPTIGASGAIAGLMGAFLVRFWKTKIKIIYYIVLKPGKIKIPAWLFLGAWFLEQFIRANSGVEAGVAFWEHVGGFVFGAAIVVVMQAMDWLHPSDPEGDEDDSYGDSMEKTVRQLENKNEIVMNPTHETLPALLTVCRMEPENVDAHLSLARFQYENNLARDCAIAYGAALCAALSQKRNQTICSIYHELKSRCLITFISKENIYRLVLFLEEIGQFEEAVRLAGFYVKKYTQCPNRPKVLYRMYKIYKNQLRNEIMAKKAVVYLKKAYPHFVRQSA